MTQVLVCTVKHFGQHLLFLMCYLNKTLITNNTIIWTVGLKTQVYCGSSVLILLIQAWPFFLSSIFPGSVFYFFAPIAQHDVRDQKWAEKGVEVEKNKNKTPSESLKNAAQDYFVESLAALMDAFFAQTYVWMTLGTWFSKDVD